MKIFHTCIIGMAVIGCLTVYKFGSAAYQSANDYRSISNIDTLATASAVWTDATVALSLERSVTQVALALPDAAPAAFVQLINEQRALEDELFADATTKIKELTDLPNAAEFKAGATQVRAEIENLRVEVDAMLAKSRARRDPKRVKELPFEFKTDITELKSVGNLLSIENTLTSNTAYSLVAIQNLAWEVREFGGRARTYYAIATLTKDAIPDELRALVRADSARAASAWSDLQKMARVAAIDDAFLQQIEAAGKNYFEGYLDLIARLDETMQSQQGNPMVAYPIEFDAFFARSNEALDGFATLSNQAGQEVREYWEARKATKLRDVITDLVAVFCVIGILVFMLFAVSRRITSRVAYATKAIAQVADGDTSLIVDERKNDLFEIKELTSSLGKLIQGARKTQELMATLDDVEEREKERQEAERNRAKLMEAEAVAQEEKAQALQAERARLKAFEVFQQDMRDVLGAASSGSFDRRMQMDASDENLIELAKVINDLLAEMETNIFDIMSGIGELADGNLAVRLRGERQGAFLKMKNDFNAALEVVSSSMRTIMQSGENVSMTSGELQSAASVMSARAEQDAHAAQETSVSANEMAQRISRVVENAKAADAATRNILSRAQETREIADATEKSMDEMRKASGEINRVVKVIEEIAFQINLLALNAGVEAARAGEAGRGFSVVASEVRSLAQRSQDAVQDVNRVIAENTTVVDSSSESVRLSRNAIVGIISEVEVATGQITEIASAIEKQATGVSEINSAMKSVEASSQSNAASLEELTASSVSLNRNAQILNDALSKFTGVSDDVPAHSGSATYGSDARWSDVA